MSGFNFSAGAKPEPGRNTAQKEKGRIRGVAADSPESHYTRTKTLCKPQFQVILGSLGSGTQITHRLATLRSPA
jgi:hypothetical protein